MNYDTLSNEELLKIIVGENNHGNVVTELLEKYGDLREIFIRTSEEELNEIKGLGRAKISQIKAIKEISYRLYEAPTTSNYRISSPNDAFNLLKSVYMHEV